MGFWPSDAPVSVLLIPVFRSDTKVRVTVVLPTGSIATQLINFQWTFSPGVQESYRIRIYDSAGTTLVYDTGLINSPSQFVTLDGALIGLANATTYNTVVNVVTSGGEDGQSEQTSFTLAAATGNGVTGLNGAAVNSALPHAHITWTAFTPSGAEVFKNYNVWRRKSGTTAWTRIAGPALTDRTGDVSYDDYTIPSGVAYQYAVTARVTDTAGEEESNKQGTPASVTLSFTEVYLHDVSDTADYATLLVRQASLVTRQDQQLLTPWGRQQPTLHIGDQESRRVALTLAPQLYEDNLAMWTDLADLLTKQRTAATVYVLRWRLDSMFCNISTDAQRQDLLGKAFDVTVDLQEVHYDEAV